MLSGCRIVELGAGPGLPGLFAAATGAHVCITDLAKVVPLIEQNIAANASCIRHVAPEIAQMAPRGDEETMPGGNALGSNADR